MPAPTGPDNNAPVDATSQEPSEDLSGIPNTSDTGASLRSTAVAAAFRTMNGIVKPVVKSGVGSPLPVGGGIVVLETVGRRSGLRREVPVLSLRLGDRVLVSTFRANSQWMRNLDAEPESRVWINGKARDAEADVRFRRLSTATLDLRKAS